MLSVEVFDDLHGLDEAIDADLLLVVIFTCLHESFVAADAAGENAQEATQALYAPTARSFYHRIIHVTGFHLRIDWL